MKKIFIATVGKIKTAHWQQAVHFYKNRLAHSFKIYESTIKDADSALPMNKRLELESGRLSKLIKPGQAVVCFDEHGHALSSVDFAAWLSALWSTNRDPLFIIGGAYGLSPTLLTKANLCLSLSPMTFPHELACVLLYEQLYRAQQILAQTGYHHA